MLLMQEGHGSTPVKGQIWKWGGGRHANSKQFLENHLKSKNILLSQKKCCYSLGHLIKEAHSI